MTLSNTQHLGANTESNKQIGHDISKRGSLSVALPRFIPGGRSVTRTSQTLSAESTPIPKRRLRTNRGQIIDRLEEELSFRRQAFLLFLFSSVCFLSSFHVNILPLKVSFFLLRFPSRRSWLSTTTFPLYTKGKMFGATLWMSKNLLKIEACTPFSKLIYLLISGQ